MEIVFTDAERQHVAELEINYYKARAVEAEKQDQLQKLESEIADVRKQWALIQQSLRSAVAALAVAHDAGPDWELRADRVGITAHGKEKSNGS